MILAGLALNGQVVKICPIGGDTVPSGYSNYSSIYVCGNEIVAKGFQVGKGVLPRGVRMALLSDTAGFMLPKGTTSQMVALSTNNSFGAAQKGVLFYNTTTNEINAWNGTTWTTSGGGTNLGNSDLTQTDTARTYDANEGKLDFTRVNSFSIKNSSNQSVLEVDGAAKKVVIGDIAQTDNGTTVIVDDVNQIVEIGAGGFRNPYGLELGVTLMPNYVYYPGPADYSIYATSLDSLNRTVSLEFFEDYRIGKVLVIADLDRLAATYSITIDAGSGKTIVSQIGESQTYVLNTNGACVTIQKVTETKWMVVATNNE